MIYLSLYFFLISFSFLGYGVLTSKLLNIKTQCFGVLGILGITFITLISYSSTLFLAHNFFFNSIIHLLGIFLLILFFKNITKIKKELILFFIFFIILIIFILVAKNHDDFPYYHFPYIILLTEFSHPIGMGLLNNGFRSPSSIFFLSSMFYLPKIEHYLFHLSPAFILGFSNIILFKMIFDKSKFENLFFLNILSLFIFCFINIFFYRLAEHGTDRSGMILAFIAIIYLLNLTNNKKNKNESESANLFKLFAILICFIVSIKPFYLIYLSLFLVLIINQNTRKIFVNLLFTKSFFYCLTFIFFTIFFTFINIGCLIFPISQTCFENLDWSISNSHISDVKIWFELWSKAGATPTNVVEDRIFYISDFNWISNWIVAYFFNKMSDFLLGLTFLTIIIFSIYYKKNLLIKTSTIKYKLIYLFIFLFFLEWFIKHPTLRYGGYHIIALIFFIPICVYLQKVKIDYKNYLNKTLVLITITLIVFITRNISRLNKEAKLYNYNPIKNSYFQYIGGDKNFYFRYNDKLRSNSIKYSKISLLGDKISITKLKKK